MNPIKTAAKHFERMKTLGLNTHFCLSTLSEDGFPNSRFLDLKTIDEECFYFGTDDRSKKALEFNAHNRVAACFWWEQIGIQIRIKGEVFQANTRISEAAFQGRELTAKATSTISEQSQSLSDPEELKERILELTRNSLGNIPRPSSWWIWGIKPINLEILEFTEDRIYVRTFFERKNENWVYKRLSP